MSKQSIYVKHKDEIMLEIVRLQQKKFSDANDRFDFIEAKALNHGKIQGLMWAAGLFDINNEKRDQEFADKIDALTNKGVNNEERDTEE